MKAVDQHPALVRQSCESGADAIVMGAGLPLDLPEMCAGFPDVALVPILSDARGVAIVLRRWMRKGRLPDAVVIEHPAYAGGHLGATRIDELHDPRFEFDRVIEVGASYHGHDWSEDLLRPYLHGRCHVCDDVLTG